MQVFCVKFKSGNRILDAIVSADDRNQQFKVEMVTNEPEPILLSRSENGEWSIIKRGLRNFSDEDFKELEMAIAQSAASI